MTRPPAPVTAEIDAQLRVCSSARQAAEMELAHIRRRQAELVDLEMQLLVTIEGRCRRADRLLDQRLRATAAGIHPLPVTTVADPRPPVAPEPAASAARPLEALG